jgi:hypothetical protein
VINLNALFPLLRDIPGKKRVVKTKNLSVGRTRVVTTSFFGNHASYWDEHEKEKMMNRPSPRRKIVASRLIGNRVSLPPRMGIREIKERKFLGTLVCPAP